MKTRNFGFEIMKPNLANKDILYNENILKLDSLMNTSVTGFINEPPIQIKENEKFIVMDGKNKNQICYKPHDDKPIDFLTPVNGMIFFVQSDQDFFIFQNNLWNKISRNTGLSVNNSNDSGKAIVTTTAPSLLTGKEKFIGIQGEFSAPEDQDFLHLYVNENVKLNLDNVKVKQVTFIIKQHYQTVKKIEWPDNILWQNKAPHQMTAKANAMDMIRIYRLIETNHFLGEIIGQDYQF